MGTVKVIFYGELAKITKEKKIEIEASILKEVINRLIAQYGENLREKIYDKTGNLRRFINIYVNGKDIRFINQLETALREGDSISIIPAVGGG